MIEMGQDMILVQFNTVHFPKITHSLKQILRRMMVNYVELFMALFASSQGKQDALSWMSR